MNYNCKVLFAVIFFSATNICFIGYDSNKINNKISERSAEEEKLIVPGEKWFDTNGDIINAHGGDMLYHEGKYSWFGEYKGERSNAALIGVTCYSSSDLYTWEYEGIALLDKNGTEVCAGYVWDEAINLMPTTRLIATYDLKNVLYVTTSCGNTKKKMQHARTVCEPSRHAKRKPAV